MQTSRFPLLATILILSLAASFATQAQEEPAELIQARTVYQKDVEFATRPIRDRYQSKLEALKRALGSKGDARGALAVQEEIDKIKPPETGVARFAGVWMLKYESGTLRRYTISPDGLVTFDQEGGVPIPVKSAKITSRGSDFLVEVQPGALERLSISGKTLTIEHFGPKTLYPSNPPSYRATGTLLPKSN